MNSFRGTLRLVRLIVRLDRVKLGIWVLLTVGLVALTVPQLIQAYGSPAQRVAYATATSASVVTRLLNGALTGPSMGEITVVETSLLVFLMLALMNIFLVVRHTRKSEENGRAELLGSMAIGRQAMLTAVLLVALLLNIVCSGLLYASLVANGLPTSGSLLFSVGIGASGMMFAAVAATMAQLFQEGRAANSAAAGLFGFAFLIRGVGDAIGQLAPGGLGVQTHWLSYWSPLGWITGARPYGNEQAAWLLLFIPSIACWVVAAYVLLVRRDMGAGVFAPKPGRSRASRRLLKPFGLLWRINKTSVLSWATGLVLTGAVLGAVAKEFEALISGNEDMQKLLSDMGAAGSKPTDIMFSVTFVISAIAVAAFITQLLVRMRSEETSGRLGLVLSTSRGRIRWLLTSTIFAFGSGAAILVASGLVTGAVYAAVTSEPILSNSLRLGGATLAHLPAVLATVAAVTLLFGTLPKYFVPLAWSLVGGSLLIFQLGALLNLPQWVINISPFAHTPVVPAADISVQPLLWLSLTFVGLYICSLWQFSRRDLTTG